MASSSQLRHSVKYSAPLLIRLLPDLRRVYHKECHGPCPFCGGADRFIAWENGYGWCRQCHWKGDSIQLLRDRDHLTFQEALRQLGLECFPPPRQTQRLARVHSLALARAKQAYYDWQRHTLTDLTDQYRLLTDELEVAAIAYRALHRCADRYRHDEHAFWVHRLGALYDRHASLEHDLDILTYDKHQDARVTWWLTEEEASHG
jgi:hypothetical protein